MSLKQTICFIALAGGLAGLLCWSLVIWIPGSFHFSQESSWLVDLINLTILRGLIGGFTVGFADHSSGDRVLARWVFLGVVVGLVSGGMSGIIQAGVRLAGSTIVALIASAFLDGCRQSDWVGHRTAMDHVRRTARRRCTDGRHGRWSSGGGQYLPPWGVALPTAETTRIFLTSAQ